MATGENLIASSCKNGVVVLKYNTVDAGGVEWGVERIWFREGTNHYQLEFSWADYDEWDDWLTSFELYKYINGVKTRIGIWTQYLHHNYVRLTANDGTLEVETSNDGITFVQRISVNDSAISSAGQWSSVPSYYYPVDSFTNNDAPSGYTLTYNNNGGSGVSPSSRLNATTFTPPDTNPTRSRYTLLGWATTAGATVPNLTNGQAISANTTAYAVWQAAGINMQLQVDGAFKTVESVYVQIDDAWKTVSGVQVNVGGVWKTAF